jgi:hypothetical protein
MLARATPVAVEIGSRKLPPNFSFGMKDERQNANKAARYGFIGKHTCYSRELKKSRQLL